MKDALAGRLCDEFSDGEKALAGRLGIVGIESDSISRFCRQGRAIGRAQIVDLECAANLGSDGADAHEVTRFASRSGGEVARQGEELVVRELDSDDLIFVGENGPRIGHGFHSRREGILLVEKPVHNGIDCPFSGETR